MCTSDGFNNIESMNPELFHKNECCYLHLQYIRINENLDRDIKPPIHQSTNFFNEIFIYLLFSGFCIEINRPFLNLEDSSKCISIFTAHSV